MRELIEREIERAKERQKTAKYLELKRLDGYIEGLEWVLRGLREVFTQSEH